ncbi:MAG: malonyl-CoA synthase, partial [Gammaproteobacteria bacterium]|nr:malonyl-CoA synthase [Gammaproteobacteria bacterium]
MSNIYSIFADHFPADPSRDFLETVDGEHYSYAQLEQFSAQLASLLTGPMQLQKGDRVAVQVEKSPQVLFLYLACLRAGLIYLPLNTAYTESELAYFVENAEPSLVVCRPGSEALFARIAETTPIAHIRSLDEQGQGDLILEAAKQPTGFATVTCEESDIAVILYTSGTTGRPKGAMISHGALAANGLSLVNYWGWSESDVLLHALPIFHIHGLFVACHTVLLSGSKMLFISKFDADKMIELMPQATAMMGVPTFYTRLLLNKNFTRDVCSNMRLFISGSAPLLEQTFYDFRERSGHTILERYGMTETGMNTSNPLDGERLPGTVGFPLPGVEARIVDDTGKTVANGEVGNLQVRGANVFAGYWRMPEKTAEEFTEDGYFKTGDMSMMNAQGYISIVGRDKDMVITGGFNVYPKEIELVIDELPGILESAVIGLPHPDFGEAVSAVVVAKDPSKLLSEAEMIQSLKKELAGFKVPKRIFIVEALPRNTMGKVQKNLLREQYQST